MDPTNGVSTRLVSASATSSHSDEYDEGYFPFRVGKVVEKSRWQKNRSGPNGKAFEKRSSANGAENFCRGVEGRGKGKTEGRRVSEGSEEVRSGPRTRRTPSLSRSRSRARGSRPGRGQCGEYGVLRADRPGREDLSRRRNEITEAPASGALAEAVYGWPDSGPSSRPN
ncbi:hypothetical protein KM043_002955 [Ampulex compressa]|nr:hypothetical protein KM043_002955 [Ampulex compressa]